MVETKTGSVICNRQAMADALAVLSKIVPSRIINPICGCVKLETSDGKLMLSATNYEIYGVFTDAQVQVESPMEICVKFDKLHMAISAARGETVKLVVDGDQIKIISESCTNKLSTMPAKEFPPRGDDLEVDGSVEISIDAMERMLGEVAFAISDAGAKYTISGVHLFHEKRNLVAQAANGKTASETNSPAKGDGKFSCTIPRKPIDVLLAMPHDNETLIELSSGKSHAEIKVDDLWLRTNLIEDVFPPMRDIIPKDDPTVITLAVEEFADCVNQVELTTNDLNKGIRVNASRKGLVVTSRCEDGESVSNYPCKVDGRDIEFGLNCKQLQSILASCDDDEITLKAFAPNRPVVFERSNSASRMGAYIVNMVVNLNV